ncbi:ANTAR domain-containing protein [Amycolatopsis decaplanina]|uniref:Putative RNA-binding protein n=1 Tax=Amycolatopsis decaplanina DSM 44594 TaxID=1284240 RepID=M2WR73_9PSEU|nr:ANTAR domain-containing protein [Amycolatopsis decaplanina]EME51221.1 putative RNA-binding protein [Amycolatopsis decaplanina DSM 44594]
MTPPDDLETVLARLRRAASEGQHLGTVASLRIAVLLGLDALTIDLITGAGNLELVWCDPVDGPGHELDSLQYTLGDGPTLEAARQGYTVSEPDLAATDQARWPLFLPAAMRSPARAVIATPLRVHGGTFGALTGYRATPGALTASQSRDFHRVRDGLLPLVLRSAACLVTSDSGRGDGLGCYREEVQQAAGLLAVTLAIPPDQALARLRAYAFRDDRSVTDLARDVLTRRLRLDDHST